MIRPSSTSSPPLRAGFPSHATLSLLFPFPHRRAACVPSLSLPPLSVAHAHTHNTRSLHVHHSRHCLLLRAPAPFLLRCLCSPSKLLSSFRCTRDSALEVAGHRPVAEALVLLKAPPPPPPAPPALRGLPLPPALPPPPPPPPLSLSFSLCTQHVRSAVTECSLLQPVSSRSQDLTPHSPRSLNLLQMAFPFLHTASDYYLSSLKMKLTMITFAAVVGSANAWTTPGGTEYDPSNECMVNCVSPIYARR